jgi:hypothetical protein
MKRIVLSGMWAIACVGALVGCDSEAPSTESDRATNAATEEAALPEVVSPLEMLPNESAEPSDAPEAQPAAATPDDAAASAAALAVDASARNVPHPIAGRSPFPNEGETLDQPLPAKKLSDDDQFGEAIDPNNIPDVVPWHQAKKYVGYTITVEGKIVNVGQTRDGSVNFLNFHRDYRGKFYMVVFDDLAKTLPSSIADTFLNKTLRVTGEVEDHRGSPQIRILSMDQVEFVGG